ncbi:MAG TPA: DUF4416 family protein [Candidatus Glassbacteria bacterium]|nr:DUF4416 family protein [Candidatus Glassbacteria bacterium]
MKTNPPAKHLVQPVKLFAAMLFRDPERLALARAAMCERYGEEDFAGSAFPFSHTNFYQPEMGAPLYRVFLSFRKLVPPGELAGAKLNSDQIEKALAGPEGGRTVNIDPGTIDYQKVVLASFKYQGQKIYLRDGVWADLTLYYRKGGWSSFEWTFPDFKTGDYDGELLEIRRLYKQQMLEQNGGQPGRRAG